MRLGLDDKNLGLDTSSLRLSWREEASGLAAHGDM